ncbi:hypothetical protein OG785_45805 [Streptomyces sp. NBC_00006]|jgi:hypothetical protein|uniref:hypothetical protein n=1 Tax=Streptomyces sp. NBC_00006 TaxID=2975619 RepID=UPI0022555C9C|nr:hypothetical protein [Streptomyces sp. NBC_00006]MCX5537712.1 hypothetical protein [Streptomyces sp. NBC_00006]MCX5537877.1 hypothetical protein [Streptomyces sp. NBC_00006]
MSSVIIPVPDALAGDVLLNYGWYNSATDYGWDGNYAGYGLKIQTVGPVNEDGKQVVTFVDDDALANWRNDHPQWSEELWADPTYRMEIERPGKIISSVTVTYSDGSSDVITGS